MVGMGMGKCGDEQANLSVAQHHLRSQSQAFCRELNRKVKYQGFDRPAEKLCGKSCARKKRRPSLAYGGVLSRHAGRQLRGHRQRARRGLAHRRFANAARRPWIPAGKVPTDHSTLSRIRRLIDMRAHQVIFNSVLGYWKGSVSSVGARARRREENLDGARERDTER